VRIEALADADAVARAGAAVTAEEARAAVATRGRFVMALSGGHTPWTMLRALADEQMPWPGVHVVQVDERVAPAGDPDRNLTHLRESLLAHSPLRPEQIHAMPVEATDLEAASRRYARTLQEIAGTPAVLDLAHLGLGPDGHTASLFPGTAGLQEKSRLVIANWVEKLKTHRLTFTLPVLNAARSVAFLVSGTDKAPVLRSVLEEKVPGEQYPAKLVQPTDGKLIWFLDRAAASGLSQQK